MLTRFLALWFTLALTLAASAGDEAHALVLQTDFGQTDGAVAAMKGVAVGVDRRLPIHDLSHDNTPFDIWEAAYRLKQTAAYWPAGTVFVSVVDPGVGTDRSSVVLRTTTGHYFVSPDNGTLTLVAEDLGIAAVRRIDERTNRLAGSEKSYTFHGRDVYAYTGARLAAGRISFEEVGPLMPPQVVRIPHARAERRGNTIVGNIPMLDRNYGNVWTNIPDALLTELGVKLGDRVRVTIAHAGQAVFAGEMPYVTTFGGVPEGAPLLYLNSLLNVAVALNQRNFAATHGVRSGGDWTLTLEAVAR